MHNYKLTAVDFTCYKQASKPNGDIMNNQTACLKSVQMFYLLLFCFLWNYVHWWIVM